MTPNEVPREAVVEAARHASAPPRRKAGTSVAGFYAAALGIALVLGAAGFALGRASAPAPDKTAQVVALNARLDALESELSRVNANVHDALLRASEVASEDVTAILSDEGTTTLRAGDAP